MPALRFRNPIMSIPESQAREVAKVLTEALPYIRKFQGQTVVVKYGGNAMANKDLQRAFAQDIALLKLVGMNPVLVHGGGPQIAELLEKLNIPTRFVEGLRVTDAATMDVVKMVLGGLVNQQIVALLNVQGAAAVGITGKDGGLIRARKIKLPRRDATPESADGIDPGQIGEVESVNAQLIHTLIQADLIPVVAPIGVGAEGESYNINSDSAAAAIAQALDVEKLVLLTNTAGILDGKGNAFASLTAAQAQRLIDDGTAGGGMLPKIRCALSAVAGGVRSVQIINGTVPHALLLEIFTDGGIGTKITAH